jgi:hypothetical protein
MLKKRFFFLKFQKNLLQYQLQSRFKNVKKKRMLKKVFLLKFQKIETYLPIST